MGFALENLIDRLGARNDEAYYWTTHQGPGLDLLVVRGETRRGFEIKRTTSPHVSRSMRIAMEDLRLEALTVVHAADETYPLADDIEAVSAARIWVDVAAL